MTVRRALAIAALCNWCACGRDRSPLHDASVARDASPDAVSAPVTTDVSGTLGGIAFQLRHAVITRGGTGDPRIWVCASDAPITLADCQQSDPSPRTMFLAAYTYDRQRRPRWDFSEVGLFRSGVKATSAFGRSGKLEILEEEPRTGVLRIGFSVDFGEARPTAGVVYSTITSEAVNP